MKLLVVGLTLLTFLGDGLCGFLFLESRKPQKGANMVLMGVPLVALPTLVFSLCALIVLLMNKQQIPFRGAIIATNIASIAVLAILLIGG
jgi:hypothetical protein